MSLNRIILIKPKASLSRAELDEKIKALEQMFANGRVPGVSSMAWNEDDTPLAKGFTLAAILKFTSIAAMQEYSGSAIFKEEIHPWTLSLSEGKSKTRGNH